MEKSDVVIIGGVACGPKTGAVLARRRPELKITLFQRESRISYGTCGMPYFASGDINSFNELDSTSYGVPRDADYFRRTRGFEVRTACEVTAINRSSKTLTVKDLESGKTFEHEYGQLVIATGANPATPPFEGPKADNIRPFTRPDDAIAFRRLAEQGKVGKALVVGGGFIGCEVAEAAGGLWGIEVTLVEKEPQVLPYALDPEMSAIVENELRRQDADLHLGRTIERIELNDDGSAVVHLDDGSKIESDYVFLCLGVKPEVRLAEQCGLKLGDTGGIAVDEHMRTSDENIYAGGDCVESRYRLTDKPIYLPMGSIANRHGRVIAENLAGNPTKFPPVVGSFFVKVFDVNVGTVGLSSSAARKAGIETASLWGSFPDKPDYYPESNAFTLKMIYETASGRLLGLQAVGAGDICRRIDVFSSFLQRDAQIEDLLDFEPGYAPPYSEALDPLYHLAAMAEAQRRGTVFLSPRTELTSDSETVLIDVRLAEEFESEPLKPAHGQCPDPINIPLENLEERAGELDRNKRTVLVCKRGPRSYLAACILKAAGFEKVEILSGGLQSLL